METSSLETDVFFSKSKNVVLVSLSTAEVIYEKRFWLLLLHGVHCDGHWQILKQKYKLRERTHDSESAERWSHNSLYN